MGVTFSKIYKKSPEFSSGHVKNPTYYVSFYRQIVKLAKGIIQIGFIIATFSATVFVVPG